MSLNPATIVKTAPNAIVNAVVGGAAMAGGVGVGMYLASAINAAIPQATIPIGTAGSIGVGDVVASLVGVGVGVIGAKSGNAYVKKAVEFGATGIVSGIVVNKLAAFAGLPAPFVNIIPAAAPAAMARSRNLYGGRIIPSSAYAGRSFAVNPA